jgi:ATP-dependent 26S proteasome regulatory subunit
MCVGGNVKKVVLVVLLVISPTTQVRGFAILEIIKATIVKAIKAADLAIQRQQNKVIWLQNAQKQLENAMAKLKLKEIGEWTEKQKEQYSTYFDELRQVKSLISYYQRVKEIVNTQALIVREYQDAWQLLKRDIHFTPDEVKYMGRVYTGILKESLQNLDQLGSIIQSARSQMSDGKRLEIINSVADHVNENIQDLRLFNHENIMFSIQRSKDEGEIKVFKRLYGLK